jgi:hypothetical protein
MNAKPFVLEIPSNSCKDEKEISDVQGHWNVRHKPASRFVQSDWRIHTQF